MSADLRHAENNSLIEPSSFVTLAIFSATSEFSTLTRDVSVLYRPPSSASIVQQLPPILAEKCRLGILLYRGVQLCFGNTEDFRVEREQRAKLSRKATQGWSIKKVSNLKFQPKSLGLSFVAANLSIFSSSRSSRLSGYRLRRSSTSA